MPRITWALLAWAILGVVGAWAADGASHVGGPGYPSDVPAWLLFEVWAVGFVLLATIGSKVLGGTRATPDRASTEEPPRRKTTLAILGWTVLWIVLVGIWALDPAGTVAGEGPGPRGPIGLKPPDWVLFDLWFLGFLVLGVIWFVMRMRSAQGPRSLSGT
jgi:hypothetical protein